MNIRLKLSSRQKGFSLVELMIVVAIIGILAALAVPKFNLFQAKARQAEVKSNLSHIYTLQQSYFGDNDKYVEFKGLKKGSCAPAGAKLLGFTPSPCDKLRYAYKSEGTESFTATGEGSMKVLYPGCPSDKLDTWTIDVNKNLTVTVNGLAECGGN